MKAIKKLWKKNESTRVNLTNLPLTTWDQKKKKLNSQKKDIIKKTEVK
jgi:hypothetical protein